MKNVKNKKFNNIILIIVILITIILLLSIYSLIFKKTNKDYFSQYINCTFLSSNQLFQILKNSNDNYYSRFYGNDFKARNITNINDYLNIIKESVSDFNENQKDKLKSCIYEVDDFFKSINTDWIDGKKMNNIEWIFGLVKGKDYERGLPHTRDNIIILSEDHVNNYSNSKLIKTLIHEKVHLYQKMYLDDVNIYLIKNNFVKVKMRDKNDNIRANPDLDDWIYKNDKDQTLKAIYNENPTSIEDIKYYPINIQSYEHPFEKMAIEVEDMKK
jgi:hypothetical protein